jgi:Protein of unknown function (DUF2865)
MRSSARIRVKRVLGYGSEIGRGGRRRPRRKRLAASGAGLLLALLLGGGIGVKAQSAQNGGQRATDPAISQDLHQLAVLQEHIHQYGCDKPIYAVSVEGCRQLNGQAAALSEQLRGLGAADSEWVEPADDGGAQDGWSPARPVAPPLGAGPYARFRTRCVRLCDGYYFPLSYGTDASDFGAEQQSCQSSCSSPAELFYEQSGDDDPSHMISVAGRPYDDLPNAYRYRRQYIESCRCHPEPWSAAAQAEYQRRAVMASLTPRQQLMAAGVDAVASVLSSGQTATADASAAKSRAASRRSRSVYAASVDLRSTDQAADAGAEPQGRRRGGLFSRLFGRRSDELASP